MPEQLVCCALWQLCVYANHKTMAAVTEKACTTDTCVGTMCIEEKKKYMLASIPTAADSKLHVRGHKRSNMQRFAHLYVQVVFELKRGTQPLGTGEIWCITCLELTEKDENCQILCINVRSFSL